MLKLSKLCSKGSSVALRRLTHNDKNRRYPTRDSHFLEEQISYV